MDHASLVLFFRIEKLRKLGTPKTQFNFPTLQFSLTDPLALSSYEGHSLHHLRQACQSLYWIGKLPSSDCR